MLSVLRHLILLLLLADPNLEVVAQYPQVCMPACASMTAAASHLQTKLMQGLCRSISRMQGLSTCTCAKQPCKRQRGAQHSARSLSCAPLPSAGLAGQRQRGRGLPEAGPARRRGAPAHQLPRHLRLHPAGLHRHRQCGDIPNR